MALFSSEAAAQDVTAPTLPIVWHDDPVIQISGTGCQFMTVTLKSTTEWVKPNGVSEKRILTKIFTINCLLPTELQIVLKEQIDTANENIIFSFTLAPHLRNNKIHPTSGLTNKVIFNIRSAIRIQEDRNWHETYNLPLRRLPNGWGTFYAPPLTSSDPVSEMFNGGSQVSNIYIPEFKNNRWTAITNAALLNDLLHSVEPLELQLIIVGNHKFGDPSNPDNFIDKAQMSDGSFPFRSSDQNNELKWDEFLVDRANSIREFIFGSGTTLNIPTIPAQKINEGNTPPDYNSDNTPNAADDSIDPGFRSYIFNRFADTSGNPNIATIDALNLRKAYFGAGCIFLWDPINCGMRKLDVFFDTNESEVLTNNSKASRNQAQLNQVKQILDKYPTLRIRLEGHTDNIPALGYLGGNNKLSLDRAASVQNELINMGLAASRFDPALGYGEDRPDVPNNPIGTPDGTPQNRRVIMRIISCS